MFCILLLILKGLKYFANISAQGLAASDYLKKNKNPKINLSGCQEIE